jgi:hypothetical protein
MSAALNLEEETKRLCAKVRDMEARMKTPEAWRDELSAIQSRYDNLASMFGTGAPSVFAPVPGETPLEYQRRRLKDFVKYSPSCKNVRCDMLGSDNIGIVEQTVIADAQKASYDPKNYAPGSLNPIKFRDEAGRECTRFVGDNMAWMRLFMTDGQVGHFRDPGDQARFDYFRGVKR